MRNKDKSVESLQYKIDTETECLDKELKILSYKLEESKKQGKKIEAALAEERACRDALLMLEKAIAREREILWGMIPKSKVN